MSSEALKIARGQQLDPHEAMRALIEQGYQRVAKVSDPGEMTLRGGILDLFPEGFEAPVRIELDGNTVVSIRSIHPFTGHPFLSHEILILLPTTGLHRSTLRAEARHPFMGEDSPLDPFVDIKTGDFVVHVAHGIGRYLGTKKAKTTQGVKQHLVIEYADKDRLYIPMEELHLVQKYIGFEGRPPKLSKLGTRYWDRSKEWARTGAASVAAELLRMEARRLSAQGHAFKPDTEWQRQLEASFPYPETAGQKRALQEVKGDMESPTAMDRLLCGDVGYGKTEVALRAVFKALNDDRQVALLCPTTILAEQHYNTFSNRMKEFPITIGMLSRFQTPAGQKQIIEGLAKGTVDLVIGTHRLFSKDVKFKNLGMVIIDEEQRFGVRHKEKLKQMRAEVDVLSMTATPIPRTLYQALVGAKAMSLIDTPPFERLPVKTEVLEEDAAAVREAIIREKERGGQVFVVYPWIQGITKIWQKISTWAPEVKVAVAHGQMPARALEKAMLAFMHKEVDVLVSTAIVESGIDIPNANTMIVFRADTFGLADLYQLRGRVGRFTRQAHCLFLTLKDLPVSGDAGKRLEAVKEFASLGAGFQIALQDMQLRGAGNLLGTEQHGHIASVGFDLYCRLLRGEIERLRQGNQEGKGNFPLFRPRKHARLPPMRNILSGAFFLLAVSSLAAGCGNGGKVAAIVNGHVITVKDVDDRLASMNPQSRSLFAGQKDRLLDQMVVEAVLVQEANKRSLARDNEVKKLTEEAGKQILVGRLLDILRKERESPVAEDQIAQFYQSNRSSFQQPESWRVSHILVADEETARKALDRVKGGESFAKVAEELSIDPSKSRGGDIGSFSKGQVIPEFEEAVMKLKPGDTSGVIKTSLGYHVIQLNEHKPAHQKAVEEVRDQIQQAIQNQQAQQNMQAVVQELRSKAQIKIRERFNAAEPVSSSPQQPAS